MRKVLLVDDEKFIRKGLRAMIEASNTSFSDITECINGREALQKIREEYFDLVVTDIRMPFMDGIAFMKEAQSLERKPQFVILSGYDDFHYAKEAISCGAKAYLLKPVKEEELLEALKKVEAAMEEVEVFHRGKEKVKILLNQLWENETALILQSDSLSVQKVRDMLEAMEIEIFNSTFSIAVLRRIVNNSEPDQPLEDSISKAAASVFPGTADKGLLLIKVREQSVLITQQEMDFHVLAKELRDNEREEVSIGVSSTGNSYPDIRKCYLEACEAEKHHLFKPASHVVYASDVRELKADYSIPVEDIKKLPEMVVSGRIKELEQLLGQILDEKAVSSRRIGYLEGILEAFKQHVFTYFNEHIPHKVDFLEERFQCLQDIHRFHSVQDFFHTVKEYLLEIHAFLGALKEVYQGKSDIDTAIAYILENYHKDINMTVVANQVSLNYYYFSMLFREQTGLSFVDFLKKIRIKKAKELLCNTDMKVNEIADRVGFQSAKHFTRTFRTMTGISPMEYRNKII